MSAGEQGAEQRQTIGKIRSLEDILGDMLGMELDDIEAEADYTSDEGSLDPAGCTDVVGAIVVDPTACGDVTAMSHSVDNSSNPQELQDAMKVILLLRPYQNQTQKLATL